MPLEIGARRPGAGGQSLQTSTFFQQHQNPDINGDTVARNVIAVPRVPDLNAPAPVRAQACHTTLLTVHICEFYRVGRHELTSAGPDDLEALRNAIHKLLVDVLRVVPADTMTHTPLAVPEAAAFGPAVAASLNSVLKRRENNPPTEAMSSTQRAAFVNHAKSVAMALSTRYVAPLNPPPELMQRWHPLLVALVTAIEHPTLAFMRPLWSEDRRTLLPPVDFVSATPPQPKCWSCRARENQHAHNTQALDRHDEGYGKSQFDSTPFLTAPDEREVTREVAIARQEAALVRDGVVPDDPCTLCPCLDALPDALYDAFEELGVHTGVRSVHVLDDPNTDDGRLAAQKNAMPGVTSEEQLRTVPGISDVKLVFHVKATRDAVEHLTGNFEHPVGGVPGAAADAERDCWDRDLVDTVVAKVIHDRHFRDAILANCNPARVAREVRGERWVRDDMCAVGFAPYHRSDLAVEDHQQMADAHHDALDCVAALHKLFPAAAPLYNPRPSAAATAPLWVPAWFHLQPVYGLATSPLPASIKTNVFPQDGTLPRHLVCGRTGITLHEWLQFAASPAAKIALDAEKSAAAARKAATAAGRATFEDGKQRMLSSDPAIDVQAADWTFLRAMLAVFSALHAMHSGVQPDRVRAGGAAPGVAHGRISPLSVVLDPAAVNALSEHLDPLTQRYVPVARLAQLTYCRLLPREHGEAARVRGDRLDPAPQHRIFDLSQVLSSTMDGADLALQHDRAQKRQQPHQWLIAHDLWAVAMLILQFLAVRTATMSADVFAKVAKSSGANARTQVARLLVELADRCLPAKCWRQLYLVAERLCGDIPKLSKERLTTPTRDRRHPFEVLNLSGFTVDASGGCARQLVVALNGDQSEGHCAVVASPAHSKQAFHQFVHGCVKRGDWRFSLAENRRRFIDGHHGSSGADFAAWLGLPQLLGQPPAAAARTAIGGSSAPLHFREATSGATLVVTASSVTDLPPSSTYERVFVSVTIVPASAAQRTQRLLEDLSLTGAKCDGDKAKAGRAVAIPQLVCPVAVPELYGDMRSADLVAMCTFGTKPTIRASDLLAARGGRPLGVGFAWRCVSQIVPLVEHLHTERKTALRSIGLQTTDIVASSEMLNECLVSDGDNFTTGLTGVSARLSHIAFAANTVEHAGRTVMRDSWDCEYPAATDTNPASSLDDDCYLHDWRSVVGVFVALAFGTDAHCAVRAFSWLDIVDRATARTREADRASTILKVLAGRPAPARTARVLQHERRQGDDRQHEHDIVVDDGSPVESTTATPQLLLHWGKLARSAADFGAGQSQSPGAVQATTVAAPTANASRHAVGPPTKSKTVSRADADEAGPCCTAVFPRQTAHKAIADLHALAPRIAEAKRSTKPSKRGTRGRAPDPELVSSSDSDTDQAATAGGRPNNKWSNATVATLLDFLLTNVCVVQRAASAAAEPTSRTVAFRQWDRTFRAYPASRRSEMIHERRNLMLTAALQEHKKSNVTAVVFEVAKVLSAGAVHGSSDCTIAFEHAAKVQQAVVNAVDQVFATSTQFAKWAATGVPPSEEEMAQLFTVATAAVKTQLRNASGFMRCDEGKPCSSSSATDLALQRFSECLGTPDKKRETGHVLD